MTLWRQLTKLRFMKATVTVERKPQVYERIVNKLKCGRYLKMYECWDGQIEHILRIDKH